MNIFDTHQPITKDVMQQVTTYLTTLPEQQRATVMEVHVEIRTNIGYQVNIISLPDGQRHNTEVEIPAVADDQGERFDARFVDIKGYVGGTFDVAVGGVTVARLNMKELTALVRSGVQYMEATDE